MSETDQSRINWVNRLKEHPNLIKAAGALCFVTTVTSLELTVGAKPHDVYDAIAYTLAYTGGEILGISVIDEVVDNLVAK